MASMIASSLSRLLRFSIGACVPNPSFAGWPDPFLMSFACWSVCEACVAFECFWPRKPTISVPSEPASAASRLAPEVPELRLRLNQRAVRREVLVREQVLCPCLPDHRGEELARNIMLGQLRVRMELPNPAWINSLSE